jgi:hypothetical protein
MSDLSPICLFAFNRPNETKMCLNHLSKCKLAKKSELFIFIDGPRSELDSNLCNQTLINCKTFTKKFKKLQIVFSTKNKGLASSVISGINDVFNKYDKIIVLEDDLLVSNNFLLYHNQCLKKYKNFIDVFSISGYNFNLKAMNETSSDVCFLRRSCSWGWSTWSDRWYEIDWSDDSFQKNINNKENKVKIRKGGNDLLRMSKNQIKGKINSWSIKFSVHQLLKEKLTVYPKVSKLINIGFNSKATHTKSSRRFKTTLDVSEKDIFLLSNTTLLITKIEKEFNNKFSLLNIILDKF